MPIGTAFLRIITALILSIPVLLSFSYYLFGTAIQNTFLQPGYVTESLVDSELYNRIYDEILLAAEFDEWTDSLVGNFHLSNDEKITLLRQVIPPEYVQGETERSVATLVNYLRDDVDSLEVFIDLSVPSENIKPTIYDFVDSRIDTLEPIRLSDTDDLSLEIANFLANMGNGRIPSNVPTIEALTVDEWALAYEKAFDILEESNTVPLDAMANLRRHEAEILATVQVSDITTALKLSSRAISERQVDSAIKLLKRNANQLGRVDLLQQVAEDSERTRNQVVKDANLLRTILSFGTGKPALWTALGIMALSIFSMAVVFVPYWKHVFFWPGAALFGTGFILLISGLFFAADIQIWASAVCQDVNSPSCRLTMDVVRAAASDIGVSVLAPSLYVLIIGAGGILAAGIISTLEKTKARVRE